MPTIKVEQYVSNLGEALQFLTCEKLTGRQTLDRLRAVARNGFNSCQVGVPDSESNASACLNYTGKQDGTYYGCIIGAFLMSVCPDLREVFEGDGDSVVPSMQGSVSEFGSGLDKEWCFQQFGVPRKFFEVIQKVYDDACGTYQGMRNLGERTAYGRGKVVQIIDLLFEAAGNGTKELRFNEKTIFRLDGTDVTWRGVE